MNSLIKLCFIILILSTNVANSHAQIVQIVEPGLVVENADVTGNYLYLKGTINNSYILSFSNTGINSNSPLYLNPDGGKVSIGPVPSNPAQLNLSASDDNNPDLRLMGSTGTISSDGSIYFRLDDNNNADEYFSIKGGDYTNDLFYIGENGDNFLKGDLTINGKIKETAEKLELINFLDFEVIEDFGDELQMGFTYASHHSDLLNSAGKMAATIDIPDHSRITGITIGYRDTDDDGYMDVHIVESNTSQKIFSSSKSSSSGNYSSSGKIDVNVPVDYRNNRYRVEVDSGDWDGQGIHHVIIHYVNYL